MNTLSLLAIFSILLIGLVNAEVPSSSSAATIASAPTKKAAQRSTKSKNQRRRKGTKRHPEDEEPTEDDDGEIVEESKDCPRLSVAKERCTAFGREVCSAHPNVFQNAPKIYHACLRDYCRGFARRCQILETIAQACGVDDSHGKLMEHGCDRVWKPTANGKQKNAKTARAFKRG